VAPLPIADTSSGPNARAGLSEAPVIGPTIMMIATTTPPITIPAKSPGERESTMPRIANMSMKVPMPSAKIADPQGTVSWLNEVWPMPRSIAPCEKTAQIANPPSTAPRTWEPQ
jgi:hypothetical protein